MPGPAVSRPEDEHGGAPRFREVSGTLARDVAELRSRILAEQGVDSFVRTAPATSRGCSMALIGLRETAEANARRFRMQGYSAVVVRW